MMRRLSTATLEAAARTVEWKPEDGFTQSLINATCACPLRGRLIANRWAAHKKRRSTFFGTMVHAGLAAFYSGANWEEALGKVSKEAAGSASVDADFLRIESAMARAVLQAYAETYAGELSKPWLFTEKTIDVSGSGIRIRAKVDGAYAAKKRADGCWLLEHKTKGRIDEEALLARLSFDFQSLWYALAVELDSGLPVLGILYNVIRKPQLKLKGGETIDAFVARIEEDVVARRDHYLKRWEITFSKRQMDEFKNNALRKTNFVAEMLGDGGKWFRNETACDSPFNCEFLEACSSGQMLGCYRKEKLFEELGEEEGGSDAS